ncbi:MAG: PadR family transcriptional regulator [Candidatus Cloacimonetes bacterium]|nr:PadR family transcriptional regulator [Candidatus Cloacimonadota bacterium]
MSITSAEASLLGLLTEADKHPYQIEKDVQFRDMRFWTELSMSAIYKTLVKLETMGYVESTTEISEENRARKIYRITAEGIAAFKDKLTELVSEVEHIRWQADIAFYNFDIFPKDKQVEMLESYKTKLREKITEYKALEDFMVGENCSIYPQSISRRPVYLLQGEINWVEDFILRIRNLDNGNHQI